MDTSRRIFRSVFWLALVASHGLGGRIRFLGIRQDMPSVFLQCDASVLPPVYEGLPLSILDAMAARTLRAFEECLDAAS